MQEYHQLFSYLSSYRYGKILEKQQQMLLFLSYLDHSIQALPWTIKSRTSSVVIKLVRNCVVLKFMQLSLCYIWLGLLL